MWLKKTLLILLKLLSKKEHGVSQIEILGHSCPLNAQIMEIKPRSLSINISSIRCAIVSVEFWVTPLSRSTELVMRSMNTTQIVIAGTSDKVKVAGWLTYTTSLH